MPVERVWRYGEDVEREWRCGGVEREWRCGEGVEVWRGSGGVEREWRCGEMGVWRCERGEHIEEMNIKGEHQIHPGRAGLGNYGDKLLK